MRANLCAPDDEPSPLVSRVLRWFGRVLADSRDDGMFPNVRFLIVVFLTSVVLSPLAFGMVAAYLVTREPLTRPIPGMGLPAVAHVAPERRMSDAGGVGFGTRATIEETATARSDAPVTPVTPVPPQSPHPANDPIVQPAEAEDVTASVPVARAAPTDELPARPDVAETAPTAREEAMQEVAARADAPTPEPATTPAPPEPAATPAPPEAEAATAAPAAAPDEARPVDSVERAVAASPSSAPAAAAVADAPNNASPADVEPPAASEPASPPAEVAAAPAAEAAAPAVEPAAPPELPKRSDEGETSVASAPARAGDATQTFSIAARIAPDPPQPSGLPAAPSANDVLASDVPSITGAVPMPRPKATATAPRKPPVRKIVRKRRPPPPPPQPINPFAAIFGPPPAQ
jgi:hypothetical protein